MKLARWIGASLATLFLGFGGAASGAPIIAIEADITDGLQQWTGALGIDFDVLGPITITHLGAFDSGGDGLQGPIKVAIFQSDGTNLGQVEISGSGDPLVSAPYFVFAQLTTPISLTSGTYSVVAVGFSAADPNGNADRQNAAQPGFPLPGVAFGGSARYAPEGSGLVYPGIPDGGPPLRYHGPNFAYSVPEPGVLMLLGVGLLGICLTASRRRAR